MQSFLNDAVKWCLWEVLFVEGTSVAVWMSSFFNLWFKWKCLCHLVTVCWSSLQCIWHSSFLHAAFWCIDIHKLLPRNESFLWLITIFSYARFILVSNNWAFLLFQLTIALKKEDIDPEKIQCNEYFYAGGLVEYVKWLNADKVCLSFPFYFSHTSFSLSNLGVIAC